MLKKLMIRTWFGDLPPWYHEFMDSVEFLKPYGWTFSVVNSYEWYKKEAEMQIGKPFPSEDKIVGTRKAGDWDPMIGEIFQKHLKTGKYDYWGHFNLDATYGRLDRWIPDSFLRNLHIFGNDPGAICGPLTLYKNIPYVNRLFRNCHTWKDNIFDHNFRGWDEVDFNNSLRPQVLRGEVIMGSGFFHTHDHTNEAQKMRPMIVRQEDGSLWDPYLEREVSFYHFNQTRRWPEVRR